MDQRKKSILDLENIYCDMQMHVCVELDDILTGLNKSWDSEGKDVFIHKFCTLSRLLENTAEDIKNLKEKLEENHRNCLIQNETEGQPLCEREKNVQ